MPRMRAALTVDYAATFNSYVDLTGQELRNAVIQNLGAAPSGAAGRIYFDTNGSANVLRVHDGSSFKKLLMGAVKAGEIEAGAIVNADISGTAAIALTKLAQDPLDRALHTGQQAASTISDFHTAVRTNRLDQMAAPTAAVSANSQRITNLADGTGANDAVNLSQLQASSAGLDPKGSVRVVATGNLNLSAPGATIDGVTMANGERFLAAGQTTTSQNGIYVFNGAASAATRAADADTSAEVTSGLHTFVSEGTSANRGGWILTTPDPITLGTTGLTFSQFSGVASITPGAGLAWNGSAFDVATADTSLTINADNMQVNVNGTGGLEVSSGLRVKLNGASLQSSASGLSVQTGATGGVQAYDAGLAALASFNTNGILVQTANDTFAGRTLTAPAAGITVTNGNGVSGNPTLALANDLGALEGLGSTGFAARTAADTWAQRTITGTANQVTVTNGDGVSGNPTISLPTAITGKPGKYTTATHAAGATISITQATHGLAADRSLGVFVNEVSSGEQVYPDITIGTNGDVTITFGASQGANTHRVTIVG